MGSGGIPTCGVRAEKRRARSASRAEGRARGELRDKRTSRDNKSTCDNNRNREPIYKSSALRPRYSVCTLCCCTRTSMQAKYTRTCT